MDLQMLIYLWTMKKYVEASMDEKKSMIVKKRCRFGKSNKNKG